MKVVNLGIRVNLPVILLLFQSIKIVHFLLATELGIGQVHAARTIWCEADEGILAYEIRLIRSKVAALLIHQIPWYSLG